LAPPEAIKISPVKTKDSPNVMSRLEMPKRISSNSRMLPSLMAGSLVVPWLTGTPG